MSEGRPSKTSSIEAVSQEKAAADTKGGGTLRLCGPRGASNLAPDSELVRP
jgi:hypothetical protein